MKFYFHVSVLSDWIFNRLVGGMFLLIAILLFISHLYFYLYYIWMLSLTIDLPAQIFVTLGFESVFRNLWSLSYWSSRDSVFRCIESRISDCLETLVLEILQIAWFPEGKCISGNLSGYQSYMEIRNTKSGGRKREEIVRTDVPMRKFTFNLLARYCF